MPKKIVQKLYVGGFILCLIGLFAGKVTADTVPQEPSLLETFDPHAFVLTRKLTPEQMKRDLAIYVYAITHAYGGYTFAPERGSQAFVDQLNQLDLSQPKSTQEFAQLIYDKIELVQDRHFSIGFKNGRPGTVRPGAGVGSNFGHCGCGANFCQNTCTVQQNIWELNYADIKDQVAVLSLHNMAPPSAPGTPKNSDPWKGYSDAISKVLGSSKVLIVDLRGNGGGVDHMGAVLASQIMGNPYDENPTPYLPPRMLWSVPFVEMLLSFEQYELSDDQQKGIDTTTEQATLQSTQELLQDVKSGKKGPVEFYPQVNYATPGPRAFGGQVYVIIDRNTGSSAESTADFLRTIPGAKTVGENTAGAIQFGGVVHYQLPNTGLAIALGHQYTEYADHIFRELVGITPDISVPQGQDSVQYLMKNILNLD